MGYIESGKKEGAKLHSGGESYGEEGYFIKPTIFTDTKPGMKIVKEEIFGPVAVLIKFKSEEGSSSVVSVFWQYRLNSIRPIIEVINAANDTSYGLGCNVFSENIRRALRVAHELEAGSAWVSDC